MTDESDDPGNPNDESFKVERITKHRVERGGAVEYYVAWKGYGDHEGTWEPKTNLKHPPKAVEAYEKSQATLTALKGKVL